MIPEDDEEWGTFSTTVSTQVSKASNVSQEEKTGADEWNAFSEDIVAPDVSRPLEVINESSVQVPTVVDDWEFETPGACKNSPPDEEQLGELVSERTAVSSDDSWDDFNSTSQTPPTYSVSSAPVDRALETGLGGGASEIRRDSNEPEGLNLKLDSDLNVLTNEIDSEDSQIIQALSISQQIMDVPAEESDTKTVIFGDQSEQRVESNGHDFSHPQDMGDATSINPSTFSTQEPDPLAVNPTQAPGITDQTSAISSPNNFGHVDDLGVSEAAEELKQLDLQPELAQDQNADSINAATSNVSDSRMGHTLEPSATTDVSDSCSQVMVVVHTQPFCAPENPSTPSEDPLFSQTEFPPRALEETSQRDSEKQISSVCVPVSPTFEPQDLSRESMSSNNTVGSLLGGTDINSLEETETKSEVAAPIEQSETLSFDEISSTSIQLDDGLDVITDNNRALTAFPDIAVSSPGATKAVDETVNQSVSEPVTELQSLTANPDFELELPTPDEPNEPITELRGLTEQPDSFPRLSPTSAHNSVDTAIEDAGFDAALTQDNTDEALCTTRMSISQSNVEALETDASESAQSPTSHSAELEEHHDTSLHAGGSEAAYTSQGLLAPSQTETFQSQDRASEVDQLEIPLDSTRDHLELSRSLGETDINSLEETETKSEEAVPIEQSESLSFDDASPSAQPISSTSIQGDDRFSTLQPLSPEPSIQNSLAHFDQPEIIAGSSDAITDNAPNELSSAEKASIEPPISPTATYPKATPNSLETSGDDWGFDETNAQSTASPEHTREVVTSNATLPIEGTEAVDSAALFATGSFSPIGAIEEDTWGGFTEATATETQASMPEKPTDNYSASELAPRIAQEHQAPSSVINDDEWGEFGKPEDEPNSPQRNSHPSIPHSAAPAPLSLAEEDEWGEFGTAPASSTPCSSPSVPSCSSSNPTTSCTLSSTSVASTDDEAEWGGFDTAVTSAPSPVVPPPAQSSHSIAIQEKRIAGITMTILLALPADQFVSKVAECVDELFGPESIVVASVAPLARSEFHCPKCQEPKPASASVCLYCGMRFAQPSLPQFKGSWLERSIYENLGLPPPQAVEAQDDHLEGAEEEVASKSASSATVILSPKPKGLLSPPTPTKPPLTPHEVKTAASLPTMSMSLDSFLSGDDEETPVASASRSPPELKASVGSSSVATSNSSVAAIVASLPDYKFMLFTEVKLQ